MSAQNVQNTVEVVLPSGVRYTDLRLGGGGSAVPGYLVILDFSLKANGELVQVRSRSTQLFEQRRTCSLSVYGLKGIRAEYLDLDLRS